MSEPLAATLLSAAVLAIFWASATRRRDAPAAACGGCSRASLLGALAMVRPEYLGVALLLALSSLPAGSAATGGARSHRRRSCWPGSSSSSLPGRSAMPMRSTASCRSRPAAARCCSPAPTCPPTAIRTGRGRGRRPPPGSLRPGRCAAAAAGADPRPARRARYPQLESDQALSRMGKEQLWDDVSEEPLEYAGFLAAKIGRIWSHGPRGVMREPVWEALHWALARPRLARPRPACLAAAVGGAGAGARSSSRSRRSAPCWSPRRGGSW